MLVEAFDSLSALEPWGPSWARAYAADPHAHVFVSWDWMRIQLEKQPHPWVVLTVRPDREADPVAFVPLLWASPHVLGFRPVGVLKLSSQPLPVYSGFVVRPEYEKAALTSLAEHIQHRYSWQCLQLENVLDPRLGGFLDCFPPERFRWTHTASLQSPYIPLPGSWDEYLRTFVGRRTRKFLRQRTRDIAVSDSLCVKRVECDIENGVDVVLALWQRRWGPNPAAPWHRHALLGFAAHHPVWIDVLWDGATPAAALATVCDPPMRVAYAYLTGYDPRYAKLSPGKLLLGHAIRSAIGSGFGVYDLMTGPTEIKRMFGPRLRSVTTTTISRTGPQHAFASGVLRAADAWRRAQKRMTTLRRQRSR